MMSLIAESVLDEVYGYQFVKTGNIIGNNKDHRVSFIKEVPCRVGLVVSVSASHTVGREVASRLGHTKDHNKNGTNRLPALHAMR